MTRGHSIMMYCSGLQSMKNKHNEITWRVHKIIPISNKATLLIGKTTKSINQSTCLIITIT